MDVLAQGRDEEGVAVLRAERNATVASRVARDGDTMENGRIVLDCDATAISASEAVKEFSRRPRWRS